MTLKANISAALSLVHHVPDFLSTVMAQKAGVVPAFIGQYQVEGGWPSHIEHQ
jgi:hypothetical protein